MQSTLTCTEARVPQPQTRISVLNNPSAAAPTQFQDPGCLGDPTLGKVPCAPTAASVYAWADYSALLASRWQGGPAGCFTHFIVWNEVDLL